MSNIDDPINPKHYGGDNCALIGERLSANSYQILKYNWRLGKKGPATIELGKSLWYLDREIALVRSGWKPFCDMPPDEWFLNLCADKSQHVINVVTNLVGWNRHNNFDCLFTLHDNLTFILTTFKENQ